MELSKTRDNVKSLIKTCEEKIKVKIKENNSSELIQKKLTEGGFLHIKPKSMLNNNSNCYDNSIKKTKIKKMTRKNEYANTKENNPIKNLYVHTTENSQDDNNDNKINIHHKSDSDNNSNLELKEKRIHSTHYEKTKKNPSNDSIKYKNKSEENTFLKTKKKNNIFTVDETKNILDIENNKINNISFKSIDSNEKLKNNVTENYTNENFSSCNNSTILNHTDNDNPNTGSLHNHLHILLSDNNKVIINNSTKLNKVTDEKHIFSKPIQEDTNFDNSVNIKNEDSLINNDIDKSDIYQNNKNNENNIGIKNVICNNKNENVTKLSSYIIENSFKKTNDSALSNVHNSLNSDSINRKENFNFSDDLKKCEKTIINCNNINSSSDDCKNYDEDIKKEIIGSTCDSVIPKNNKKNIIKKELFHKMSLRNSNKMKLKNKDEEEMEEICEYKEKKKRKLKNNNSINYLNNSNIPNSNAEIINSLKLDISTLDKEDKIQTSTSKDHTENIDMKHKRENINEHCDYNTKENNKIMSVKRKDDTLNNSIIINNNMDSFINESFNMNCNEDFDKNYNEIIVGNNSLLPNEFNKKSNNEINNFINDDNNNKYESKNNEAIKKNNENLSSDYDTNIKEENPDNLSDKKCIIKKILSKCDSKETELFDFEKLRHLIIFRENAEKYIQSYINSFLKDFNIMSSYLPFVHYYDKDIYEEKECNFFKILSYFIEHFKNNKKIKKKICSFQKNFLKATINEKIKYIDKFQLLKLSEIGTDIFKRRFLKLLKKCVEKKKKKKKEIYCKLKIFNKIVKNFYKLKDKMVENNLLQKELNDLNVIINDKKKREICNGGVTDNTLINNITSNDTLDENILNVNVLNYELTNSNEEKKNVCRSEISECSKIDYFIPYSQKYIFKYLNLLIENKLFNLIHLNNSKYIENIHIKDNGINFYNRIIFNSIPFYKGKIKKLCSILIMYYLMNKSLRLIQPNLTWNVKSYLHKKRYLQKLYSHSEDENSHKLVERHIIEIEKNFRKMINGKNKKKKSILHSFINENEKLNLQKYSEDEIEKDMDIFINNLLIGNNSIKNNECNDQNNENIECNKFCILENSKEYVKYDHNMESQKKEIILEKKEELKDKGEEKNQKLCENEKEKEQKVIELEKEKKNKHTEKELEQKIEQNHEEQLQLRREQDEKEEEKKEKYKGRERKKRKNNKFKLSNDLQDIYDAYNNGEQIIIAKNKNKLLNNLEKYNNFNYLSKQTLFDTYNSMQNNNKQNVHNLNVNDINEHLRNINSLQNNYFCKNMNTTNFVNRNNSIDGINSSSLYKYMYSKSNSYFNNDLLQKYRFDQKNGENEYYESSINSKNNDYNKYINKLNNLSINEKNTFISNISSNSFIKNDNLKDMYPDYHVDNGYMNQNLLNERIKFLNDIGFKKEKYSKDNLRNIPYYTENNNNNNNNFFLAHLRNNIRNNMPLNSFMNCFDNSTYNLYNSMNNPFLFEKIQKENSMSNHNISTNFTASNNSLDSINLQAHIIDKNDLNKINNFLSCDKNIEHLNNASNGMYMHLNRQINDAYINNIPNNNNNDFNKIKNENINNNMINKDIVIDNIGLFNESKNINTVDNKISTTDQNKKHVSLNNRINNKKNNNINDNNIDVNNGNDDDLSDKSNNSNDNSNNNNNNNCNNDNYNSDYNSNFNSYENNVTMNEKNSVNKETIYNRNKNILNNCIIENELKTNLNENITKNNINKDMNDAEGTNQCLNNNHEVINNSNNNNKNINIHIDTNINGYFDINKKNENINYINNININENNKNNYNLHENNLYNYPIKNFDNSLGSNKFLEDNIIRKELTNENKMICDMDNFDNNKNSQNVNISNINGVSSMNLLNNGNINELDKNTDNIKTNTKNSYNNIGINVNNNDTLKNFNCTIPFFYMNNLNNVMEYTNNNHINNNISVLPPYVNRNQINNMFYLNNMDNFNKYNIYTMNNMMKSPNIYHENFKLNDKNYNVINNYNSFNINGLMPYNNTNNDLRRYINLGKKNNINVYNYNINEKDNTELASELVNMHPNNIIDQFNYLNNCTNNNYINGCNFINFDQIRNDINMNVNMNINDYNKTFNEIDPDSNMSLKNYKKKDKVKKEKKNNTNKVSCSISTNKKKRFGNTGPPSAEKLNELLHEQNLSVPQIAAIYGVHRTTVARWCHNRKIIQKSTSYHGRRRTATKNNNYI
ncbi:conserved Plasmodium protein, unknown function [Plasmodium gallinaceum]|uniref:Uncharacterized protein n=1 Tax=Plasmodium gallinaceum TaxID=5849 RepID=A0A1J1GQW9_PLAGA|nr:conserved Plasmodium protein, unknown function [Plasmodium gallinaceum]CRG94859.1 conserved Plasmodium protein, unknown function [Plasmodium gallinaceum]